MLAASHKLTEACRRLPLVIPRTISMTRCYGFHFIPPSLLLNNTQNPAFSSVQETHRLPSSVENGGQETKTHNHRQMEGNEEKQQKTPLMALNHVSRLCRDVKKSINFYTKVLGMVLIERPHALDFDGAWLYNYGVGIHLMQAKDEDRLPDPDLSLDPMDNHVSFQCEDMEAMEQRLRENKVEYKNRIIDENGTKIDKLFFKDPDGFMIEICNCEHLKLVPAGSIGKTMIPLDRHNPPVELEDSK